MSSYNGSRLVGSELRRSVERWLADHFANSPLRISAIYLFGSVARAAQAPRDVDVLLVTDDLPVKECSIRAWKKEMNHEFMAKFFLPLTIVIMLEAEAKEQGRFIRRLKRDGYWLIRGQDILKSAI